EGETLSHVASHLSKLPTEKLLMRWMAQLADALGYLHRLSQPIIYRNLRPDTVLLTSQADVLLVDFGLARLVDTAGTSQTLFRRTGDTSFAPPEQFSGLPSTPDVDIYSLGATMYTLATGKLLPSGWDRMFSMAPVVPLQSLNPYISEAFAGLIHQMVNLEPAARPQTMEEVQASLKRLQTTEQTAPPPAAPAPVFPAYVKEPPTLPLVALNDGWKGPFFGRRSAPTEEHVDETGPNPLDRWPVLDITTIPLDRTVGQLIPETMSAAIDGVCIGHPTDYELLVAVSDPRKIDVRKHIGELSHHRFVAVVVRAESDIIALARRYLYGPPLEQPWLEWVTRQMPGAEPAESTAVPVMDGLYKVLQEALALRMTDLHLETHGEEVVLRHRVEGRVRTVKRWPRRQAAAWFYEIRRLGGLVDVAEALPCSGRARLELDAKAYDVRISLVPGLHGQNAVLRLVERVVFETRLDGLGLSTGVLGALREVLQRRSGLLLVGGPKGSGTTTTLYAALRDLENGERKLVTIESPVEGEVPGTIQIDLGDVAWDQALREALCQDPDAVLLSELPDPPTVRLAALAALEDHLMLSTVPVGRAAAVITALLDRGLSRDVLAASLAGCMAQRLVRQLCSACKVVDTDTPPLPGGQMPWRARGCERCGQTGYAGRLAVAEFMVMTQELRGMVRGGASEDQLQAAAQQGGMIPLLDDGMARVTTGLTTATEVTRACRIP
ncbi:MAG TPA: ATPase, T2SS/T4P/T4SS family, partial [Candidatus Xenobia bacterium]